MGNEGAIFSTAHSLWLAGIMGGLAAMWLETAGQKREAATLYVAATLAVTAARVMVARG